MEYFINVINFIYRRDQQRSEAKLLSFTQIKDELLKTRRQFYGTDLSFDPQTFKACREVSTVRIPK